MMPAPGRGGETTSQGPEGESATDIVAPTSDTMRNPPLSPPFPPPNTTERNPPIVAPTQTGGMRRRRINGERPKLTGRAKGVSGVVALVGAQNDLNF